MTTVALSTICDAIESTLSAATTLNRSESYDELSEGIQDVPLLQVYPVACDPVTEGSRTDRWTFEAVHRIETFTFHADYFANERSHIDEDMSRLVNGIDAMTNILEAQTCDRFGLEDTIKFDFQWRWNQVIFEYGGVKYMGARFVITMRIF